MKKYILSLFIIFSTAVAFAAPISPFIHSGEFDTMDKKFFEKFVFEDGLVTSMVCVEEQTSGEVISADMALDIPLASINNWLNTTEYYIKENNRQEEFADILEIINRKRGLEYIPCEVVDGIMQEQKADLPIIYTRNSGKFCGANTSCRFQKHDLIVIYSPEDRTKKEYIRSMSHELGHSFGLGDQYSGQIYRGSYNYNSGIFRPSIMEGSDEITCDDVDGFITTIDRLNHGKERTFYSLCGDGLLIKNGRAVKEDEASFDFHDNYQEFNADVMIEPDEKPNGFVMRMLLSEFILSPKGLSLVRDMGFKVDDYETLKNIEIYVRGSILEKPSKIDDIHYRKTPFGLWVMALSVKEGEEYKLKQAVFLEFYPDKKGQAIFSDMETSKDTLIEGDVVIPLIEYYPEAGYGDKEDIKAKYESKDIASDIVEQSVEIINNSLPIEIK